MYETSEMASFVLMNFERDIAGLTEEEAQTQLPKPDGTRMNSISWIVAHMAWHWSTVAAYAKGEPVPPDVRPYIVDPEADPTPPTLEHALQLLSRARASSTWIALADDALLSTSSEAYLPMVGNLLPVETVGTALMRVILHTWFHIGEVNAIRQMLGHEEIIFVGPMNGLFEYRSEAEPVGSGTS